MSNTFKSIFKDHLEEFVRTKRQLGRKFETAESILKQFDRLAYSLDIQQLRISKTLADKWCARREWESPKYHQTRVSLLNSFATYCNDQGIESFIPKIPYVKQHKFIPFIFTHEEIAQLLKVVDNSKIVKVNSRSTALVYPFLLRLLYATGIRIKEALNLKRDDFDTINKCVKVKDFKNSKERIIPISKSLNSSAIKYFHYQDLLNLPQMQDYIFLNLRGQKISSFAILSSLQRFHQKGWYPMHQSQS